MQFFIVHLPAINLRPKSKKTIWTFLRSLWYLLFPHNVFASLHDLCIIFIAMSLCSLIIFSFLCDFFTFPLNSSYYLCFPVNLGEGGAWWVWAITPKFKTLGRCCFLLRMSSAKISCRRKQMAQVLIFLGNNASSRIL